MGDLETSIDVQTEQEINEIIDNLDLFDDDLMTLVF